jgi:hypothetical protein
VAILITLGICAPTRGFAAEPTEQSDITVRTYDTFGVKESVAEEARAAARMLLADAGVRVRWRECRTPGRAGAASKDACSDRVARVSSSSGSSSRLGQSWTRRAWGTRLSIASEDGGRSRRVFADRIRDLAVQLGVPQSVLLGRAMSHEIGHLLLGTVTHSLHGVMRGHWSANASADEWTFTSAEALQMRLALGIGIGPAPASLARGDVSVLR